MTDDTTTENAERSEQAGPGGREAPRRSLPPTSAHTPTPHRLLTICLVVALVLLTFQWWQLTQHRPDPLPWQHGSDFERLYVVDINNATWVEWTQIKGIGKVLAHRIVADRESNGPFSSIEDLRRVKGIGPATLDQIRPWLTISHGISKEQDTSDRQQSDQQPSPL